MRVRFGKKLHGNRKIAQGKAECFTVEVQPTSHSNPCNYLFLPSPSPSCFEELGEFGDISDEESCLTSPFFL